MGDTLLDSLIKDLETEARNIKNHIHSNLICVLKYFNYVGCNDISDFVEPYEKGITTPDNNEGIYIFKVITQFNINDCHDFNSADNSSQISYNISPYTCSIDNPLYVGKSKKIKIRLRQHCNLGNDNSTYSLKLQSEQRKGKIKDENVKIYSYELKEEFREYYIIICSTVESYLHKIYTPHIGSKRV